MNFQELMSRYKLVKVMKAMEAAGLNHGTAGNASVRCAEHFLVTPSGVPPLKLKPSMIVKLDIKGHSKSRYKPTSEWKMHVDLLAQRPDMNAVVHCHSRFATTLACAGLEVPSLHYMTAVSGGLNIPLAPYATYGTAELAQSIAKTLQQGRRACLMANHGQIAMGTSLEEAFIISSEVEVQASYYYGTLVIGKTVCLSEQQMHDVVVKFKSYGQNGSKPPS